jgi:FkbM family methyltransferase
MGVGAGSSVNTSGEASVLRSLRDLPNEDKLVIFDVGANKGEFLQMSVKVLAPRGGYQIHCFEPSKTAYSSLSRRAEGVMNVTLNNVGLGRETGQRLLYADKLGSGLASLTKRRLDHFEIGFSESESVDIETLDNYCALHAIDHIDLLKIDVEGHELDVLAGGAEMLRKKAVRLVTFEFGGCNIDTRTFVQDVWYFFLRHGMRIARITPGGFWCELGEYSEVYEQFRTTNFAAYLPPVGEWGQRVG